MSRPVRGALAVTTTLTLLCAGAVGTASAAPADAVAVKRAASEPLRVATYNLSLNRNAEGQLVSDLSTPDNAQARTVAEVIQRTAPDVVLLNEFDYVEGREAVDRSVRTTSRSRRTAPRPPSTRTPSWRPRTPASRAVST